MKEYRKGEKVFDKVYPILMTFYLFLKILPEFVSRFLWSISREIPGYFGIGLRYVLLKRLAKECGKNVSVMSSVYLHIGKNLKIGSHISIREDCYIDGDNLEIGDNVMISHSSSIITGSHYYDKNKPMRDTLKDTPVKIGDNVWIGSGARIIGETTIGDDVIIAANAVVIKPVPSNVVVAGVPAIIVRRLDEDKVNEYKNQQPNR